MIETRNSTLPERLGNGRSRQTFYGYPVLFREDGGEWQENNPQWVDGKLTGVPYKLAVDTEAMSLTMTDVDGSESSITLKGASTKKVQPVYKGNDIVWADYAPDIDVVIHADTHFVSFQRILKSPKASKSATFEVKGNIPVAYRAFDKNGKDVVVAVSKDGDSVTESFEATNDQYPITIDPTLTVQPATQDGDILERFPDTSYGTGMLLVLLDLTTWTRRCLFEFDISSLPSNATITSATLGLYYNSYGNNDPNGKTVWAYKLSRTDWVDTEATWNIYKTGSSWTSAGGDYVTSNPSGGSTTFPAAADAWMEWDVQDIVEDAVANENAAEILLKYATEGLASGHTDANLRASEHTTANTRPKLVIEYKLVQTTAPSLDALLKAVDSASINLDAYLRATDSQTIDLDTLLRQTDDASILLDVIVGLLANSTTIDIDALLRGLVALGVDVSALLRATDSTSIDLDALIAEIRSITVSLSALLRQSDSGAIDLDALLKAIDTKTIDLDILLEAIGTSAVDLDVRLNTIESKTVELDALLEALDKATVTVTTLLRDTDSTTIDLDAHVAARIYASVALDVLLEDIGASLPALSVLLRDTDSKTIDLDALLEGTGGKSVALDAILWESSTHHHYPPYTIEIRDSSDVLLGVIKDLLPGASLDQATNVPDILSFSVPIDEIRAELLTRKNQLWVRDSISGTVISRCKIQMMEETDQ